MSLQRQRNGMEYCISKHLTKSLVIVSLILRIGGMLKEPSMTESPGWYMRKLTRKAPSGAGSQLALLFCSQ